MVAAAAAVHANRNVCGKQIEKEQIQFPRKYLPFLPSKKMSKTQSQVMLSTHDMHKVYGYCVVGLILCLTGAVLLVVASVQRQFLNLPEDFQEPRKLRYLLQEDRKHDAMFNAGISILTSGLLLLFGFGITEYTAGIMVKDNDGSLPARSH